MVQSFPPTATVEIAAEQVDKLAKADSRNKGAVWGWVAGRSAAKSHNDGIVLNGVEGRRNSRRTAESMYVDVPAVGPINEGLRTMARDKRRSVYVPQLSCRVVAVSRTCEHRRCLSQHSHASTSFEVRRE